MALKFNLDALIGKKMQIKGEPITLSEISRETGLSKNRLVEIRKNKVKAIKIKTLEILLGYFECSIGDLLVEEG